MNIILINENFEELPYEFVERKGKGHPDTLSDNLAEYLSAKYSQHTKEMFGVILHHNFDKVGLLGGASDVRFGYGKLTKPIRVLLNGRASTQFGANKIDVEGLLVKWATEYLISQLPLDNPHEELEFHNNLATQSSPGKTNELQNQKKSARNYWFKPRSLEDIPECKRLVSNDTSMGVGFAPSSKLEELVTSIERLFNSVEYKKKNKWIGSDIKIMGFRNIDKYSLTMCIPQISKYVVDMDGYKNNITLARNSIDSIMSDLSITDYHIDINTRDDYQKGEFYLTAIGSSIESGDEGLVGRGNRIQGIISPTRPMSMEGVAGKNPVYHIGKVYYLTAQKIAEKIYEKYQIPNKVVLVSQSGRDLFDPWITFVHVPKSFKLHAELKSLVHDEVVKIPNLTQDLINLKIPIC